MKMIVFLLTLVLSGPALPQAFADQSVPGKASPQEEPTREEVLEGAKEIAGKYGIRVVAIRTTAAGRMLDFRFEVLDKDKAMPFFVKELKPHLIDKKTGAVLEVPVPAKGGPMRPTSRDPREGITYFMLFANPGGFVQPGNEVAIKIGDLRVDNLVVQ